MAVESKPPFRPEVLRQQVRVFILPERLGEWQPKLEHRAGLIASGRADQFKETALFRGRAARAEGVVYKRHLYWPRDSRARIAAKKVVDAPAGP